eukprot:10477894-Heterocapsa_arctica.AAC.1
MESSGAAETATTDAASSQGDVPAREPCPPAAEEGPDTVMWGAWQAVRRHHRPLVLDPVQVLGLALADQGRRPRTTSGHHHATTTINAAV